MAGDAGATSEPGATGQLADGPSPDRSPDVASLAGPDSSSWRRAHRPGGSRRPRDTDRSPELAVRRSPTPPVHGRPSRAHGRSRRAHARRRRRQPVVRASATLLVAAGLVLGGQAALFRLRLATVAPRLLRAADRLEAAAGRPPLGVPGTRALSNRPMSSLRRLTAPEAASSCPARVLVTDRVDGLDLLGTVHIPTLGVDAPLVEGDGPAELAVAVGRLPASAEPGHAGTLVLAAHDVSWFSEIDHLRPGDRIDVDTACGQDVYQVTRTGTVPRGSPLRPSRGPTLVLETCWPIDALYFTPERFLVDARLVTATPATGEPLRSGRSSLVVSATAGQLGLPAATRDPALGPPLPHRSDVAPLGRLRETGSPSADFRQSVAPLHAEADFLELYWAGLEAATRRLIGPFHELAPGVTPPIALDGATVAAYLQGLSPTLTVDGTRIRAISAQAEIALVGGPAPGDYRLEVTAVVHDGELSLRQMTLTRL